MRFPSSEKRQAVTMMTLVEIYRADGMKYLFCAMDGLVCTLFFFILFFFILRLMYSSYTAACLPSPIPSLCMSSESVTRLKQSRPLPWQQQLD